MIRGTGSKRLKESALQQIVDKRAGGERCEAIGLAGCPEVRPVVDLDDGRASPRTPAGTGGARQKSAHCALATGAALLRTLDRRRNLQSARLQIRGAAMQSRRNIGLSEPI